MGITIDEVNTRAPLCYSTHQELKVKAALSYLCGNG